jgi:hypothetical protein
MGLTESKLWLINCINRIQQIKVYKQYIMARTKPQQAAVQPSKGSKITFGEDDIEDDFEQEPEAGPSKRSRRQPSSEPESDDDDDDDEAPEAVGVSKEAVEDDSIASAAEALAQYVCFSIGDLS